MSKDSLRSTKGRRMAVKIFRGLRGSLVAVRIV